MGYRKVHSKYEAFMLLIKDIDYKDLDNLYKKLGVNDLTNIDKKKVYNTAINIVLNGEYLGNNTINNINTSSWINHSIWTSIISKKLAHILGLNEETAIVLGLLHDIGRKFNHSFDHITIGYNYLIENNYLEEANICLTHSFVKGGRCANNEPALEGFQIIDGKVFCNCDDDISLFLNNYTYNWYDYILNIADLMATSSSILSPYDRIKDIETRRKIDLTNRAYFLSMITNLLIEFMNKASINNNFEYLSFKDSLDKVNKYFKIVSDYFYGVIKWN